MKIKVFGDLALFTRPEYKAEPHSYPVMPPSSAIGLLESIFWKPEISYIINTITVLNPIKTIAIRRNMVKAKQDFSKAKKWAEKGKGRYFANEDRTQCNQICLRDVAYVIDFNFDVKEGLDPTLSDKYYAQISRRIEKGQTYRHPYFGCREYIAFFEPPSGNEVPHESLAGERDLGLMPVKMHFVPDPKGKVMHIYDGKLIKCRVVPEFKPLVLIGGILNAA